MRSFLLLFFATGQSLSQSISKSLSKVYTGIDGLNHLRQMVSQAEREDSEGRVARNQYPLPTPRPQYNINAGDVEYYLQHSLLANCDSATIQSNECFCQGKFDMARRFTNATLDAYAVVAVDPRNRLVVVSYRATVTETNWDTNFLYQLVDYPDLKADIKVHRGHLSHLLSIHHQMEPVVLQYLSAPEYSEYKLHVTGYSLGASVSAIALPIWQRALKTHGLKNKMQMIAYEGPRPGNLEFALYLESMHIPIVRYVKQGDVVPHYPDQNDGFSQVGQEFYDISTPTVKKDLVKCSPKVMEDIKCSLGDSSFRPINHITPFQKQRPRPPFC